MPAAALAFVKAKQVAELALLPLQCAAIREHRAADARGRASDGVIFPYEL